MITLTNQEKIVLLCLAGIILFGGTVHYALKRYPQLINIVNVIDSDRIHQKVDINRAGKEALVAIPYIGDYTAQKIIDYRQENGPIIELHELKKIKGIREKNFERFSKYLKVAH